MDLKQENPIVKEMFVPEKPLIILNAVPTWTKENNFTVTGFDYAIKDAGHKSKMSARLLVKFSSHHGAPSAPTSAYSLLLIRAKTRFRETQTHEIVWALDIFSSVELLEGYNYTIIRLYKCG